MTKNKLLRLFIFLVLFGCQSKETSNTLIEQSETPMINIEHDFDQIKEFRLSHIADDIEYIKLEKTPETNIGGGRPVWHITNEFIFVFTSGPNSGSLLQFSRKGKFIRQIGKYGRGPGEFISILGMSSDDNNKNLYVIANFAHKVLTFDLITGEFLRDFPINRYLGTSMVRSPFQMIKQDTFIALSDPQPQFTPEYELFEIFDFNGKVISRRKSLKFSIQDNDRQITRRLEAFNQIWIFDGHIRLFEDLNDTIYNIEGNKISPAYILNLGPYKGPFDFMTTVNIRESRTKYLRLFDFWETHNYLFFRFYHEKKSYKGQFNKRTREFHKILETKANSNRLYNDIDGGLPFWPWYAVKDKEWICCFDAIDFKKQLSEEWFQASEVSQGNKREKLKKFVDNLSIDDNPVLMIVKLK